MLKPIIALLGVSEDSRCKLGMTCSPAILGPSGSGLKLLGGGEDPWLCVSSFCGICLYRDKYAVYRSAVNSGMYLS